MDESVVFKKAGRKTLLECIFSKDFDDDPKNNRRMNFITLTNVNKHSDTSYHFDH